MEADQDRALPDRDPPGELLVDLVVIGGVKGCEARDHDAGREAGVERDRDLLARLPDEARVGRLAVQVHDQAAEPSPDRRGAQPPGSLADHLPDPDVPPPVRAEDPAGRGIGPHAGQEPAGSVLAGDHEGGAAARAEQPVGAPGHGPPMLPQRLPSGQTLPEQSGPRWFRDRSRRIGTTGISHRG